MTASLAEIRTVLAGAGDRLVAARESVRVAQTGITEAIAVLGELDRVHDEPLVPDELRRAEDELARAMETISVGVDAVAAIGTRL